MKNHFSSAADWPGYTSTFLAQSYFQRDPGSAVDWALTLPESPARTAILTQIQQSLTDSTSLTPANRQMLQSKLSKP